MQKFRVLENNRWCAVGTTVRKIDCLDEESSKYELEDGSSYWFFKDNQVELITEEQLTGLFEGITDLQLCALWHCLYVSRKVLKESTKHLQFSEESFNKLYNEADLMWDRIDELCTAKGIDPMKMTVTKATEIK